MVSDTSRYALRAVAYIAEHEKDGRVSVGEIAEDLDIPRNYLSKILHQLARAGILDSLRGPKGGFVLAVPADELVLERVIDPVQPFSAGSQCLLGRPECRDDQPCAAHETWKPIAEEIRRFFRETTVESLIRRGPARKRRVTDDDVRRARDPG